MQLSDLEGRGPWHPVKHALPSTKLPLPPCGPTDFCLSAPPREQGGSGLSFCGEMHRECLRSGVSKGLDSRVYLAEPRPPLTAAPRGARVRAPGPLNAGSSCGSPSLREATVCRGRVIGRLGHSVRELLSSGARSAFIW